MNKMRAKKNRKIQHKVGESVCIFCGKTSVMTGEHTYPQWIKDILPLELAEGSHSMTTSRPRTRTLNYSPQNRNTTHSAQMELVVIRKSGDPGSVKIPVCGECNSGWMSRLQSQCQETLTPIINGQWPADFPASFFNPRYQQLASWCIMTATVLCFAYKRVSAADSGDRYALKIGMIPSQSLVYIGMATKEFPSRASNVRTWYTPKTPGGALEPFAQAITFHIGCLLVHVGYRLGYDPDAISAFEHIANMKLIVPPTFEFNAMTSSFIPTMNEEANLTIHHEKFIELLERHIFQHGR